MAALFFIAPSCKFKIPHVVMTALQEIQKFRVHMIFLCKKFELRQHTASLKHYWVVEKKIERQVLFFGTSIRMCFNFETRLFCGVNLYSFATDPTIMLEGCWKSLISVLLKSKRMHKGKIRIQREEHCTLTQS